MDKEQPNTDYRIFAVDLQKSIGTILNCSHGELLTSELLDELTATLWFHAEGHVVWRFIRGFEDNPEIAVELFRDANGNTWGIQYCGKARSIEADGKLSILPLIPFLREKWNERRENSECDLDAFCDAFKKHLPTIALLPYDADLSAADFANHTGLTESQVDFAGKRVVCHWLEENVQMNLVAVEVSPHEYAKPESPFENCRDWIRAHVTDSFRTPLLNVNASPVTVIRADLEDALDPTLFVNLELDAEDRADIRSKVEESGTEVLGWYQPYHEYDEENWGIYLRTAAIVALGDELRDILIQQNCPNSEEAYHLVVRMILEHEFFHARYETYGLSLESTVVKPTYRPNCHAIYNSKFGTSLCYEEALANYEAHTKICRILRAWQTQRNWDPVHCGVVQQYFEQMFDLSPKGYRDWRIGSDTLIWRKLANEARFGLADPAGDMPHLENELREYPQRLLPLDAIPIYLTNEANISDRLFATPKRRDAEKLLRDRGYSPQSGEGSHTKWISPSGSHFVLPRKDPLSHLVFHNLLRHLDMTKRDYLELSGRR